MIIKIHNHQRSLTYNWVAAEDYQGEKHLNRAKILTVHQIRKQSSFIQSTEDIKCSYVMSRDTLSINT